MTALAGYWSFDHRFDPTDQCRSMLAALAAYGAGHADARLSEFACGRRLASLLPEDRFDRQVPIGGNGRFALAADLRLDNREELAAAIGLDSARLACLADSQLLLLALERWGEDSIGRLLGDFAFAFFDSQDRRLILARDPLGQRPLFWHRGDGFLAFASMPRGLHALAAVPRRADEASLIAFLGSLPRSGPGSYYEGIERVEPGHVVTLSPSLTRRRRYWLPQRRDPGLRRFEDGVEAFRAELDAAVARRLRGAGPTIAAHLSGGWDSSAVAATAARLAAPSGARVLAFTAVPRGGGAAAAPANRFGNEGALAAATASLYPNIDHIRLESSLRSPIADLDFYAELFDRPVFNLCNHVWLSEIRAAARHKGAHVLLTGEIGNWTISAAPNTLLADYLRQGRWLDWAREAAAMARDRRARLRGIAAASFGPWLPDPLWNRVRRFSSSPEWGLLSPVHPRLREQVLAAQEEAGIGLARRPKDHFELAVEAFFEMDFGEYRKGILGGWGIDKRDATADLRLIEFCLSLPVDMLLKHGVRRPLARAALSDRLPAQVLDERRKGYQSADWHEGLTRDLPAVEALIDAIAADPMAGGLIDVDRLRSLVRAWPQSGWEDRRVIGEVRIGLLKALTAGHFVLAAGR